MRIVVGRISTTVIKKIILLVLFLLFFSFSLHAQCRSLIGHNFHFKKFPIGSSNNQSYTFTFYQDNYGFIWNSREPHGLARHDGNKFIEYSSKYPFNTMRFSDITGDAMGMIWLVSLQSALFKFDPLTEETLIYVHEPDNPNSLSNNFARKLHADQSGILWIGLNDGWLNSLDPETGIFTHYQINPKSRPRIFEISPNNMGGLWLGTDDGLYQFNPETGQATRYPYKSDKISCISTGHVYNILEDVAGVLWVSCLNPGPGLERIDLNSGAVTQFQHDPSDPFSISSDRVLTILLDSANRLWVGTDNGLNLLQPDSEQFSRIYSNDSDKSLSDNRIYGIYEDQSGLLWIGTANGTDRFNPKSLDFKHYKHTANNPNSLNSNFVYSVYEDRDGILWIGDNTGTLNRFDRVNGQITHYHPDEDNPQALNMSHSVSAIHEDSTGTLWIGTYGGGLHHFNRESGLFQRYTHEPDEPDTISDNIILSIHEDTQGRLWIGTRDGGLNHFDHQTGKFHRYSFPPYTIYNPALFVEAVRTPIGLDDSGRRPTSVRSITEDQTGILWMTSTFQSGLTIFDPRTKKFKAYRHDPDNKQSISSNTTFCVLEDKNGSLWIGTDNGINKFDRKSETFTKYTMDNGLPNNIVYAIAEDSSGHLWLSTHNGISKFDPRTAQFQNFDINDGLQHNEFNQGAFFQSKSGEIFFGGINGVTAFYPEQITRNTFRPPVQITDFKIFNESITHKESSVLQKPIWATEHITLNHTQNVFSFGFSLPDYTALNNRRYRHQLIGFEENTNNVAAIYPFATYINIPPGKYIFRVLGANYHGVWSNEDKSIKITITPPWWRTGWFQGLAALCIIGMIIGVFIRQRNTAIQREQVLETLVVKRTQELENSVDNEVIARIEAETAKEKAEKANQAKSIFLANMNHELRTPLNAVLGFSELIIKDQQTSPKQKETLNIIVNSGRHLMNLINDVLDMSKIEIGHADKLELETVKLKTLLKDISNMFKLKTENKNLQFSLDMTQLPQYVQLDMNKLRQVLINLLSNAIKFTRSGNIFLRVNGEILASNKWQLQFEVEDTGIGIPNDQLETIFEPFAQINPTPEHQGTGLGLTITRQFVELMGGHITVSSTLNQGTLFRFTIQTKMVNYSQFCRIDEQQQVLSLAADEPEWRILIVEDESNNSLLLNTLLESAGFMVRVAVNGEEGIQQFQDWNPHLIWMDMHMPVLNGYEATRRIRELTNGKKVKILALTAISIIEQTENMVHVGCDAVLYKPYNSSAIFSAMEEHLGLQYIYTREVNKLSNQTFSYELIHEDLQTLPYAWMKQFLDAVRSCDTNEMLALTGKLAAEHATMRTNLNHYIEEYLYDDLIKIFEKIISQIEKTETCK